MGHLGRCQSALGSHRNCLQPEEQFMEPFDDSGAAYFRQPVVVSVNHSEWSDQRHQPILQSRFNRWLVWGDHQLSDGRKLQTIALLGLPRQSYLHLRVRDVQQSGGVAMVVEPLILSPESTGTFPQAFGVFIPRSVERIQSL